MKKKRGVVKKTKRDLTPFFSIVAILIIVLIVFLVLRQKPASTETQKELDKTTGGVVVCGQDFPCGNFDGVCPEDYGAKCKCYDPDCEVKQ
ncbi:MAG: hypothetical protein PHG05_02955 [Candidatus Nanoarchaeia archaeon]|nr:hypothetical protein [Candidatus Nanoarchaeia archaeon]